VTGRVFERLGIPIVGALEPDGLLEGGGITYFRGDTVIVGRCDRTNQLGLQRIEAVMRGAGLRRMVTIPCHPGTIHIDGFFVLIDQDLAIVQPRRLDCGPAIIKDLRTGVTREQLMMDFLAAEGVDTIVIDESDGPGAANFVMTGPRQVVGYEWAERVMNEVERRGGRAVGVPGRELVKGNAGPHCMTLPLER
jgi:N-dimethylarginine dimethylaminohydrolase